MAVGEAESMRYLLSNTSTGDLPAQTTKYCSYSSSWDDSPPKILCTGTILFVCAHSKRETKCRRNVFGLN